jgi:UDP-N-acetylmuramoyl-L-alanyl-D-glutamate--2,6-diaminopimelate ligase
LYITPTNFDFVVQGLCLNSQQVQDGDVFVALQGTTGHGTDYIEQAIDKGCVCILIDSQNIRRGLLRMLIRMTNAKCANESIFDV